MTELWHWMVQAVGLSIAVLHLAFVPVVLARRREPAVTFAWLLVLLLLPAVGVVLYWVFGRGAVRRSARGRRALLAARQKTEVEPSLEELPPHLQPIARTAWKAG